MNNGGKIPARCEMKKEDQWKIEDLYASDELWEQDFQKLKEQMQEFSKYEGTMGDSAEQLYQVLTEQDRLNMLMENVYV